MREPFLLRLLTIAVTLAACGTPSRPPDRARALPPAIVSARLRDVRPPRPVPPALLAKIRERGLLHGEPISLPDAAGEAQWIAFLGTERVASSAWVLRATPSGGSVSVLGDLPPGARVLGVAMAAPDVVVTLLESVAVLDMPSGLRGAATFSLTRDAFVAPELFLPGRFADVHALSALESLLAGLPHAAQTEEEFRAEYEHDRASEDPIRLAVRGASAPESLFASEGIDVIGVWNYAFAKRLGRVDRQNLATSRLGPIVRAVIEQARQELQVTSPSRCSVSLDDGRNMEIAFLQEATGWKIRTMKELARPLVPLANTVRAALVERSPTTDATSLVLRERGEDPLPRVVAQAPLPAGGAIGIAITKSEEEEPYIAVISERDLRMTYRLTGVPKHAELTFADVNGDGRADVIAHGVFWDGSPERVTHAHVYITPRSFDAPLGSYDRASELAIRRKNPVNAAATSALSVPPRGTTPTELCALLNEAKTPQGFPRRVGATAAFIQYGSPMQEHQLGERGTLERKLSLAALRALEVECSEAACEVDRPVCTFGGQPGPTVFWLTWDAGLMKLAGIAVYTGS